MSNDNPEVRRSQREAFEAVLKALSVVKLDWSKQKLLGELRKHLNISQSTYVELLEKVLNDAEVKSSKGEGDFEGSLRKALHEAGGLTGTPRQPAYESENETDTENDADYRKDDEGEDDDSSSEGSTSRPTRSDPKRRHAKKSDRNRRKAQLKSKRKPKRKGRESPTSGGRNDANPLAHDEIVQYEMTSAAGSRFDLAVAKPPYDKDVFETFLLNGTMDDLKEMTRQVKKRRQALINVMLEDDDPTIYPEGSRSLQGCIRATLDAADDLVQKILLREKNVRQQKALENELSLLDAGR